MKSFRLIVFVKNAVEGQVKTRLAASIGKQEALQAYQLLLKYTREQIISLPYRKEIWYSEYIDEKDIWHPEKEFDKRVQEGNDLGDKMRRAFGHSLKSDGAEKVVLIGSDCADLTPAIIDEAFEMLEKYDVVIGPAADGGYYLIGMNKFIPEIFEGINWSTSSVFDQTLAKLEECGNDYFILEQLHDVDEPEDWERVKTKLLKL